jgi:hypothetical protein
MINEIKEQTSRLGITIRDFAQFALPGFSLILALAIWLGLPVIRKDTSVFLTLLEKSGLLLFISLAIISYLVGQFLASATHVIDNVCQLLFRRRAFGVPFILSKLGTDYRAKVHDHALRHQYFQLSGTKKLVSRNSNSYFRKATTFSNP